MHVQTSDLQTTKIYSEYVNKTGHVVSSATRSDAIVWVN